MSTEQPRTHRSGTRRILFNLGSVAGAAYLAFFAFAVVRACVPTDINVSFNCIVHHATSDTAYFSYTNSWTGSVPVGKTTPNILTDTGGHTVLIDGSQPYDFKGSSSQHSFPYSIGIDFTNTFVWNFRGTKLQVTPSSPTCAPGVTLASVPSTSFFGQQVTFSATVTPPFAPADVIYPPHSGAPPSLTGSVSYFESSTLLGNGTGAGSDAWNLNTSTLSPGNHTVYATYTDSAYGSANSNTVNNLVYKQLQPLALCVDRNNNGTYTAHWGYTNPNNTTLTIPFGTNVPTNFFTYHSATVTTNEGQGTSFTKNQTAADTFQVVFDGSNLTWNLNQSTSTASSGSTLCSAPPATTTTVTGQPPVLFGTPVTFTATVSSTKPGGKVPTGTVTFASDGAQIGTGTLNSGGVATYTAPNLAIGTHAITATYGGDSIYTGSAGTTSQEIDKDNTSTVVTSIPSPSVQSQNVTFTATVAPVAPGSSTPTGTVTFKFGTTVLGSGAVGSNGKATFNTATLPVGTNSVTANYGGDATYNVSTSAASQTVGNVPNPPSGNNAYVRFVEASSAYSSVDVGIDHATVFPNIGACSAQSYAPLSSGQHTITVAAPSGGSNVISVPESFVAGSYYTLAIVSDPTASPTVAPSLIVIQDDVSVAPNEAKVRVYHFADTIGPIAVTSNGSNVVTSLTYGNASPYITEAPQTVVYGLTAISPPPALSTNLTLNLAANQIYSVFLLCNGQVNEPETAGIPLALPQTGYGDNEPNWVLIAVVLGILPLIGGGIGWGTAQVVIRRRHATR